MPKGMRSSARRGGLAKIAPFALAGMTAAPLLLMVPAAQAQSGDIVVALIEDEATVKRYYPEGDRIRFQPANATMQPIYVSRADFRSTMILGQVVGVYRKLPGGKG